MTLGEREKARPTYAGAFRCIGPECEDNCCHGWEIPVDKATYERYTLFPADQLGWAVSGFVSVTSAEVPKSLYAHIHMGPSGECPFFEADQLCGIQKTYGPELLSATCSSYPRALNRVDGLLEGSLSLSCPEATRDVLLDPTFLERTTDLQAAGFRTDNFFWLGQNGSDATAKPFAAFHTARTAIVDLVRDRSRPIWLRLLRVGRLCQRLETIPDGPDASGLVSKFLAEDGEGDGALTAFSANRALRLQIAMQLSDERVRDESSGRRFQEIYWKFVEGIASAGPAKAGEDIERLAQAERMYYQPFMDAQPHVLENFLVNYIYQRLFPFGRAGGVTLRERGIFEEFLLLATQFGWLETLLIGVAGQSREEFGAAAVVETVQSYHRAVEHYGGVLEGMLSLMNRSGLDDLAGMAVMLR